MENLRQYLPVPKIFVPAMVGVVVFVTRLIATGEFDREEAAVLFGLFGYAFIGWLVPEAALPLPGRVEKVVTRERSVGL